MIGKIYSSITPFYDSKKCINSFKRRPVLITGGPRNNDYTILPVSTITRKENIDPDFDVKVEPEQYPNINLDRISYIRTHKQTIVHQSSLSKEIGDLKTEYEELYLLVLEKLEELKKRMMDDAF